MLQVSCRASFLELSTYTTMNSNAVMPKAVDDAMLMATTEWCRDEEERVTKEKKVNSGLLFLPVVYSRM
jgi:hypothetical protein